MPMKKLNIRGDTIVEVLIAMAIVGAGLSASYRISSQSLARIREAQERVEGLKLAEEQVERLKVLVKNPTYVDTSSPGRYEFPGMDLVGPDIYTFCINSNLTLIPIDSADIGDEAGGVCWIDANGLYQVGIWYDSRQPSNPDNEFYIFAGRFSASSSTSVNTNKFDIVNLMYRLHP